MKKVIIIQVISSIVATYGFGIIFILHPADPVSGHFPVRDGLLGGQTLLLRPFICFLLCPTHGTGHSFLTGSMIRMRFARSLDTPFYGCIFLSLPRPAFLSFFCFLPCLFLPRRLSFCCFLRFFLITGQPAVLPLSPLIYCDFFSSSQDDPLLSCLSGQPPAAHAHRSSPLHTCGSQALKISLSQYSTRSFPKEDRLSHTWQTEMPAA